MGHFFHIFLSSVCSLYNELQEIGHEIRTHLKNCGLIRRMSEINEYVSRGLNNLFVAAEILGVSQSRVSDLIGGKWERFSLEMLITFGTD
jgi:predicted XRE-type DNA-binding protein